MIVTKGYLVAHITFCREVLKLLFSSLGDAYVQYLLYPFTKLKLFPVIVHLTHV